MLVARAEKVNLWKNLEIHKAFFHIRHVTNVQMDLGNNPLFSNVYRYELAIFCTGSLFCLLLSLFIYLSYGSSGYNSKLISRRASILAASLNFPQVSTKPRDWAISHNVVGGLLWVAPATDCGISVNPFVHHICASSV